MFEPLKTQFIDNQQTCALSGAKQAVINGVLTRRILKCIVCIILMPGIVFLYLAGESYAQGNPAGNVKEDDSYAINFILKDLNGKDVRLSDYKGRVVLLNFMTTWCPECRASIPGLKNLHARYFEKGLMIMNISIQETPEKAVAYDRKHNLPYPTLLDLDGATGKKYGVAGVPVKVLIDRKGRILCWNCRSLEKLIEKQFEVTLK